MNKNSLIALLLLLLTMWFFTSPLYQEKILGKKPITTVEESDTEDQRDSVGVEGKAVPADSEAVEAAEAEPTERVMPARDTVVRDSTVVDTAAAEEAARWDTVVVETDKLICKLSEKGGRIVSLRTKEYAYRDGMGGDSDGDSLIDMLAEEYGPGGANLAIAKERFDDRLFELRGETQHIRISGPESVSIDLVYTQDDGREVRKVFSFTGDSYRIDHSVVSSLLSGRTVSVGWLGGIRESETGNQSRNARYDKRKLHVFDGKDPEHIGMKNPGEDERTGFYRWVGLTSKYFLVALVADTVRDADISMHGWTDTVDAEAKDKKLNYGFMVQTVAENQRIDYWFYAGPSQITELQSYDVELDEVLFGGWKWFLRADQWFPVICEWVLLLLIFLHSIVKDYGIAILLITIIMKAVTYPLTASSMKSMSRMKDLQPKINALKQKYKGNPRKMNEEMMTLYRSEGASPFSVGCLPMLLQMPLLFSLFVVLRKAIELRGAPTVLLPWVSDLSQPEVLFRLPFEIPMYGSNFALVPVVMAGLTFVQNKMTMKDPNQKAMVYFMPIFMLVLFNSFPAGLVMYWTFSSALGLVQQYVINRSKPSVVETGGGKGKSSKK